ncbi:tektin-2 [Harpegnathos saltator]|uniref:Tektin n=1 Tax=Harpegnathos saltator TaxID=610380 RepID=E2BZ16_HARSA|nr:tektin-2 [Harpegnathos saltator]EFN79055.1 Tektin-2 [Harpegnathos saltator]
MAKFASIYEKPSPHISLPDWHAKQWQLRQSSGVQRSEACQLRDSSRSVRLETAARTKWDTDINNDRLADRVTELSRWRNDLEDLMQQLLLEIRLLSDEKSNTEREIETMIHLLQVVSECISTRDRRKRTELTYDETDIQLKKELCLIADIQDALTKRVQTAREKLNTLDSIKFDLDMDIEDKNETIKIDKENLVLDRTCANISYKPTLPISEKTRPITYATWLERCHRVQMLIDDKLSDSYSFREATRVMREHAWNDVRAQQDATDYTLRKRIYQTQKARNELDWQKLKVWEEMETLKKEITRLEGALVSKMDVMKCAQTRLENRTHRPGYELCKDEVETGLWGEVLQLKQTEKDLTGAIESAKASYNGLESLLTRIEHDLDDKQHSLNVDVMCLDSRAILKTGDRARLPGETDRNIVLTRMEEEIPLES